MRITRLCCYTFCAPANCAAFVIFCCQMLHNVGTNSGADSIGHGGTCPHFSKAWHGGTVRVEEQQTINWPNCTDRPSRKRSRKRLIALLEPKSGGARQEFFSGFLRRIAAPPPLSRCPPPLSNSFRCHWSQNNYFRSLCDCSHDYCVACKLMIGFVDRS